MTALRPEHPVGPLIEELEAVIGPAAVTRLCEALGGTKLYVPLVIEESHPIAEAIGMPAAVALAEHRYGTMIRPPLPDVRQAHAANRRDQAQRKGALNGG